MLSTAQLLAFIGIIALGTVSPGPDFAIVVRQSAVSGRLAGTATSLGIGAGIFFWMVATATGLAAVLAASAIAYGVVKVVGAVYLLFLGWKALREAARRGGPRVAASAADEAGPKVAVWKAFRQGVVCNVLNPKVAVFYVALMPQFVGGGEGVGVVLLLAAIAAGITVVWYVGVANLVGSLRALLRRPRVKRAIDAVTGAALVGLGVRLAVATRG